MNIRFNRKYVSAAVLFFLLAFLTGGYFVMFLFSSLVVLTAGSYIYMAIARNTFTMELQFQDDAITAGQSKRIILSADSTLPLPYLSVKGVNDVHDFSSCIDSSITMEEKFWIEKEVRFTSRGLYDSGIFSIEAWDVLGIFSLKGTVDLGRRIKVYPAVFRICGLNTGGRDIFQEMADRHSRIENPYQIRDIRRYQNGDSLKKIHWKLSAKFSEFYSKNNENITGRGFAVIADMNEVNYSYDDTGETEELLADGIVSVLRKTFSSSVSIRILLNKMNNQEHEVNSYASMNRFIEHLTVSRSDGSENFDVFIRKKIRHLDKINHIAVMCAAPDHETSKTLAAAAASGYRMSVFYCVENDETLKQAKALSSCGIRSYSLNDILEGRNA